MALKVLSMMPYNLSILRLLAVRKNGLLAEQFRIDDERKNNRKIARSTKTTC